MTFDTSPPEPPSLRAALAERLVIADGAMGSMLQGCPTTLEDFAGLEVAVVDGPDDVRPGDVQYLVTALVPGEVIERGRAALQHGAHRAVGDHQALAERGSQAGRLCRCSVRSHSAPQY